MKQKAIEHPVEKSVVWGFVSFMLLVGSVFTSLEGMDVLGSVLLVLCFACILICLLCAALESID